MHISGGEDLAPAYIYDVDLAMLSIARLAMLLLDAAAT